MEIIIFFRVSATISLSTMIDLKNMPNGAKDDSPIPTKKQRIASPSEADFEGSPGSNNHSEKSASANRKYTSVKCNLCSMVFVLGPADKTQKLKSHLNVCAQFALMETKSAVIIDKVYEELKTVAFVRHGVSLSLPEQCSIGDIRPETTKSSMDLCLELYEKEKEKLKHVFETIPSRVCVTCDIFTDALNIEYLCLSAHFVDHNWKLDNKLLNLLQYPPTHDASLLALKVDDMLYEWGIATKILTITLNGKNCREDMQSTLCSDLCGGTMMKRKGALPCEGEFLYVNCCSSFLDYIAHEAFIMIEDPICKIREGMKRVLGCEYKLGTFIRVAGYSHSKFDCSEGFWLDNPSQWVSTYRMLDRILRCRDPLEKAMMEDISSEEYSRIEGKYIKTVEWSRVENICKLLRPLYDLTNLFMGNEYLPANSFFVYIWETGMCLSEAINVEDPDFQNLVQILKCKFDEYWESCNAMLASAVIFDPRHKLRFVKFCYQRLDEVTAEDRCISIQNRLQKLFLAYVSKKPASSNTEQTKPMSQKFEEWKREEQLYSINSQLDSYLAEPTVDDGDQLDVLSWWKLNKNRFPDLALMAIDTLSIPIATVSSNSAFNIGTRFSHKWRSSVLPENAEAQILSRNWLYGYEVDASDHRELVGAQFPILKSMKPKK